MAKDSYGPSKNAGGFPDFASPLNEQTTDSSVSDFKIGKFYTDTPKDPLGVVPGGDE